MDSDTLPKQSTYACPHGNETFKKIRTRYRETRTPFDSVVSPPSNNKIPQRTVDLPFAFQTGAPLPNGKRKIGRKLVGSGGADG